MRQSNESPEALILAGGRGSRLRGIVDDRPKPLADVAGRPFVEWLILQGRMNGILRFVLCTGYLGRMLEEFLGDGRAYGVSVEYSHEKSPLGTGGALRNAVSRTHGNLVMALNGDSYCRYNLQRLVAEHKAHDAAATMLLVKVPDCQRFGSVKVGSEGEVTSFAEKAAVSGPGLVNSGVYVLGRRLLESIPDGTISLEREVLPSYIGNGLFALVGEGPFIDIGTPESYAQADEIIRAEQLS